MEVIDLLNKIANGEEVPKKIKYKDKIYVYEKFNVGYGSDYFNAEWKIEKGYRHTTSNNSYIYLNINDCCLNDEVEIIKENNKIEKLDSIEKLNSWRVGVGRVDERNIEEYIHKLFRQQVEIFNKLNEIIDKINGGKK